jgi:hypothetical protein
MPPLDDLLRARGQLASGVGQTTRKNRVLPFTPLTVQIPARVGVYDPGAPPAVVVPAPACIGSNFWTYTSGTWYPRAWHTALDTLVSSDGAISMDRQAHKRITFQGLKPSLSTDPIHLCFASPTVGAVSEPAAGVNDIHFIETAYASREWHAAQTVNMFPMKLIGCAQRLKSIEFNQAGTLYKFRWRFKQHTDAETTGVTPTCLNRTGDETKTADRIFSNDGTVQPRRRLSKFLLVTPDGKGEIEQKSKPWGFLPATTFKDVAILVNEAWASESNQGNMTDLARLLSFGQPYHGLCISSGITTADGVPVATPTPYAAPRDAHTRYFKHPSPPGEPAPALLPPDYTAAGYQFLNDIVFGSGTDYSPGLQALPTVASWLHTATDGTVNVLGLVLVSDTATTTTWQVVKYLQPLGTTIFSSTVLGTIAITTTDPFLTALVPSSTQVRTYTGQQDYQIPVTGGSVAPQSPPGKERYATDVWLSRYLMVESSPNGRNIAVMRGYYNPAALLAGIGRHNFSLIATVATFAIAGDFSISGPTYQFQYSDSYVAGANFSIDFCMGFAYKSDATFYKWIFHEDWIDWGLDSLGAPIHQLVSSTYNGTAIPSDTLFRRTAPVAGYGFKPHTFAPYFSDIFRVSNNCLLQFIGTIGSGGLLSYKQEFSTPSGAYDYAAAMAPDGYSPSGRAASWNPRTEQLRARANSARISWA